MRDAEIKEFGQNTVAEFDEIAPNELVEGRQTFLDSIETVPKKTKYNTPFAVLAAAVLLFGVAGATFMYWNTKTNTTQSAASRAIEHQVKVLPMGKEVIEFKGGSTFVMGVDSLAKVVHSGPKEVVVALEEGVLQCRINGNGHTEWKVRAGDYQVLVTGTRFAVRWNPMTRYFNVDVEEGSVFITGKPLNTHGIQLAAGEKIVVNKTDVAISKNKQSTEKPKPVSSESSDSKNKTSELKTPAKEGKTTVSFSKHSSPKSEKKNSKYSAEELWQLGNKARYAGNNEEAYTYLRSLRSRFPNNPYGKQAPFLLGRISLESNNDPGRAKQWFEEYLHTAPNGKLAEQSIGRLIRICRNKRQPCAKKYARQYLCGFPDGPFAELAQSVLE